MRKKSNQSRSILQPSPNGMDFAIGKPFAYEESQYLHQVPGSHFQLAPPTPAGGKSRQIAADSGRSGSRACGFRLPHHGDASLAVRRQPGSNQCNRRRALQRVTDQVIQYALGLWGKEAPALDGSQRERQNLEPQPGQRTGKVGSHPSLRLKRSEKVRRTFGCRRRAIAPGLCRGGRGESDEYRRSTRRAFERNTASDPFDPRANQEK